MKMPEDENPWFTDNQKELRLVYFTLPMALNYQRNSYSLRESVLKSYTDTDTNDLFSIKNSATMSSDILRSKLMKHKIALQPNKHIHTWQTIAQTMYTNRWTCENLFEACGYDFLVLKEIVQKKHKAWFPYLSWPKIFNYWSFIIQQYWKIPLKNSAYIDIAPDTHITQCSVKLWIISAAEAITLSKEAIAQRRRDALQDTWITPIQMHSPLWFWSRNNFQFIL
jgi:hypothetical protein